VAENLQKKWEGIKTWHQVEKKDKNDSSYPMNSTIDHQEGERGSIKIQMLNNPKLHILEYKGGIIKGYSGMMELSGPPQLLQVAIDAGLGSKNSQGCGCLEVMGSSRRTKP